MANWITLRQAAEKYETTIKDILSWSELPEITFTYINHTLLLNDDSVCYFIESHSLPAEPGKEYGCAVTFENIEIIAKQYVNALEKISLLEKQIELSNECISEQSKLFESIEENMSKVNHYFQTVFRTFLRHKQYIKNALETDYSNAKLEATNKLIKDIKRLGFGFRNFINFKKRVFITLNIKKEKTYQVLSRC